MADIIFGIFAGVSAGCLLMLLLIAAMNGFEPTPGTEFKCGKAQVIKLGDDMKPKSLRGKYVKGHACEVVDSE